MKQLLILWAVSSVVGTVTTERSSCLKHAAFSSTNFENILIWETEADIPPGTAFDVQYKQYGEKGWLNKRECQSITQSFCNLTRETADVAEHFYARVRASAHSACSAKWVNSERFHPQKETVIGAPEVECIPNVRSIKFLIHSPYTPLRDEDNRQLTVEDVYSKFGAVDYHLTIFNQRTHQKWIKNEHNKEFEVSNLDPDTEYNGTVHISILERSSKTQVFWVRTLADNTWLLYCFVALAFAAGLVFAAISYMIYKYLKQRSAQPMSLDFRGMSPFQPLTLTVEHIIKPINLSKSALFTPEVQLPQLSQHLDKALDPQRSFSPPETLYQQQAGVAALSLSTQPLCSISPSPPAYAPQTVPQSVPHAASNWALPPNYGVCVEGTGQDDEKKLQPNHVLKEVSPDYFVGGKLVIQSLGKNWSHQDYKDQRPVSLREKSDMGAPTLLQEGPRQTGQLLLQPGAGTGKVHIPQQPLSLLQHGGCYRHQSAELLPLLSSVKVNRHSGPEEESLPSLSTSFLLSVLTGNSRPEQHDTKWWTSPDSFLHPENKLQFPETQEPEMQTAAEELNCTELSNAVSQDSSSEQDSGVSFTMLFKDIDLKVQWEQGMDENTEIY